MSATITFKHLVIDSPLWCGVMSTTFKNPKDQDGRKKGTLRYQPRLKRITPTALLGSWVLQPIKDVTSLGTDFEMHAYWQGYVEVPAAKDFVARKVHTITLSKVQGTHWNGIKCQERLGYYPELSPDKQQSTSIHKFGNLLRVSCPSCTALTLRRFMSCKIVTVQEY